MKRSLLAMGVGMGLLVTLPSCDGASPSSPDPSATASPSPSTPSAEELRELYQSVLYQEDPDGTQYAMSVYAPAAEGGPWPVAVMIHGAGGSRLDQWARAVASKGVVAYVPYWPDDSPWHSAKGFRADMTPTIEQLACAVRFARAEAERYGGDPSNLTLLGHSAGANFASVIAFANP
ncbi:MAG TPA: hypothetical protein VE173_09140, partial [Longimicrobiales bacterium]|nr:hypothetical protein [Longimicrobiales bacterium]